MKRLPYIDVLRGYAILGVILVHTSQSCGYGEVAAFGARGVQLFFVVSAFTLCLSWQSRDDGWWAFFVRRAFRIIPMLWISIAIYLAKFGWTGQDGVQILSSMFLIQGFSPEWVNKPIAPGGWSISVETAFYCLFPLFTLVIRSKRLSWALLIGAVAFTFPWERYGFIAVRAVYPSSSPADVSDFVKLSIVNQLPAFAAGLLCFCYVKELQQLDKPISEPLFLLAIAALVFLSDHDLHHIGLFSAALGLTVAMMTAGAGRHLVNPIVVSIGKFSYSMFFLHWLFIDRAVEIASRLTNRPLHFAGAFVLTVAMTAAASFVTFSLVEAPFIALGNRLISGRAPSGAAASRP
jgi:peptidoglycan/LPS O-acetylase OafA/YrhL